VLAVTVHNDELVAGGQFTAAGGSGSNHWARWGPDCPRGDMNCDQAVDLNDVSPFVQALLDAPAVSLCESYAANASGDTMPDGASRIDGLDVQTFAHLLLK